MATFVLIHGAGDVGWYWHLTEGELQARGHHTIAPDLPCDNDTASLDDYAGTVAGAAAGRQDLVIVYNGVPRPLAEEALRRGGRGESSVVWDTPWPLGAWPDVPTKFILCKDDQFFPAAFMRRVARERLGIIPDEVPGCHCAALSHPKELSGLLVSYLA